MPSADNYGSVLINVAKLTICGTEFSSCCYLATSLFPTFLVNCRHINKLQTSAEYGAHIAVVIPALTPHTQQESPVNNSLIKEVLAQLGAGDIVPYLGPGVLRGVVDRQTGKPMPAHSDSLIL